MCTEPVCGEYTRVIDEHVGCIAMSPTCNCTFLYSFLRIYMQRLNIQQARTLEQHSQHLCVNVVAAFFFLSLIIFGIIRVSLKNFYSVQFVYILELEK